MMDAPTALKLKRDHWDMMLEHVRACLPEEACGLLAGDGELPRARRGVRCPIVEPLHRGHPGRIERIR